MKSRVHYAFLAIALSMSAVSPALAASDAAAPFSIDQSLKLLISGNKRYAASHARHPHQSAGWRASLAKGQHPFAAVLSCSDSRVPPEIIFDEGLGDLFVVRVAGNIADDAVIGSLEYAAEHLAVPVIVVLGHTGCGAVEAAVEGGEVHDHVRILVDAIKPALERAGNGAGDLKNRVVRANVTLTVERLRTSDPTLRKMVGQGKLRIIGAIYDLRTGKVEISAE